MIPTRLLRAIGVQTDTIGWSSLGRILAQRAGMNGGRHDMMKRTAREVAAESAHAYYQDHESTPDLTLTDRIETAILEIEDYYIQCMGELREALTREQQRYQEFVDATVGTYEMLANLAQCAQKEKKRAEESEAETNALRCLVREMYSEVTWEKDSRLESLQERVIFAAEQGLKRESGGCDG